MTFDEQLTLVLIGALIGGLASLVTTVSITFMNYRLQKRSQNDSRQEMARELLGQVGAQKIVQGNLTNREFLDELKSLLNTLDRNDSREVDVMIGFMKEIIRDKPTNENQ